MSAVKQTDELHAVLVKIPKWIIRELDSEAERLGVPRTNVIVVELAKRAEQMRTRRRGK